MRRLSPFHKLLVFSGLAAMLGSCRTAFWMPGRTRPATAGQRTELSALLDSLPEPKDPLITAVYQFRDLTGQYKPVEGGSSFSTAVTQGAANILLKVLQDSKWFVPIERENIGNLLNERKIIRSTRTQYGITDELPALLFAGVMLEGGIVSYDANVITGGAGLRYFGSGASSQYREDRVTVYLRAISVSNGKILKTVYASKQVLSQSLDGGVFRYVKFRRLLETETGLTFNEPSELAVTEAIQVAVRNLIIEGLRDELWDTKNAGDRKKLVEAFDKEQAEMADIDLFGAKLANRRSRSALELGGAAQLVRGDRALEKAGFGGQIGLLFSKKPESAWKIGIGSAELRAQKLASRTGWADVSWQYRPLPFHRATPFYEVGVGGVYSQKGLTKLYPKAFAGLGFEWFSKKKWSLFASGSINYVPTDGLDGVEAGKYKDWFWQGAVGLQFYFGKKAATSRPLAVPGEKKPKTPLQDF